MSRADINLIINCSSPRPRSIRRSIERSGRLTPCSSTSSASARRSGTSRPQRALRAKLAVEIESHLDIRRRSASTNRLRRGGRYHAACRAYLRAGERTSLKPEAPATPEPPQPACRSARSAPRSARRRLDLHRLSLGRDRIARKQVPVRVKEVT